MESGDSDGSSLDRNKEYMLPKEDTESSSSNDNEIETICRTTVSVQSFQACKNKITIEECSKKCRKISAYLIIFYHLNNSQQIK